MTEKRPYAGQTWTPEANGSNLVPGAALQIIGSDLANDARACGVTAGLVELWAHAEKDLKGFFAGDTGGLPAEGWTKVATL